MNGSLRATFNGQKLQGLFINTALGNFAAYVAGSLRPMPQGGSSLAQLAAQPARASLDIATSDCAYALARGWQSWPLPPRRVGSSWLNDRSLRRQRQVGGRGSID